MRNLGLSRPHHLLSAGASPPICLSFAGWLLHCLLSRASTSRHISLHSRRTHPSLTPPLCLHQLVVALHLFTPPPPLDAPPLHGWLCHRRRRCASVVAVNARASLPSSRLQLSPSLHVVELASLPLSSSALTTREQIHGKSLRTEGEWGVEVLLHYWQFGADLLRHLV